MSLSLGSLTFSMYLSISDDDEEGDEEAEDEGDSDDDFGEFSNAKEVGNFVQFVYPSLSV